MHRDHSSTPKKLLTLTAQTLRRLTDDQLDHVAGAGMSTSGPHEVPADSAEPAFPGGGPVSRLRP